MHPELMKKTVIPLPGASVSWKGTRLGTITDLHDYTSYHYLSQRGDTLRVSMIGYETVKHVLWSSMLKLLRPGVEIEAAETKLTDYDIDFIT